MERQTHRAEERRAALHEVWMSLVRATEPDAHCAQRFNCKVINYSHSGVCAETPHFVRAGDMLEADESLPEGEFFLVRWVVSEGARYRFGCRVISG